MARIRCDRHGESDVAFVSPGIQEMGLGRRPSAAPVGRVRLEIDPGNVSLHPVDRDFSARLEAVFHLDPALLVAQGEEQSFEIFAELKPVCASCLREWRAAQWDA